MASNKDKKDFTLNFSGYPSWKAEADARERAAQKKTVDDYARRRNCEFRDGAYSSNAYYRAKSGLDTF